MLVGYGWEVEFGAGWWGGVGLQAGVGVRDGVGVGRAEADHQLIGQSVHDRRGVRAEWHRARKLLRVLHEEALVAAELALHGLVVDPLGVASAAAKLAQPRHVVPPATPPGPPRAPRRTGESGESGGC